MVDALHGWAVTNGRLWVTADGGATWRDATRRRPARRPDAAPDD